MPAELDKGPGTRQARVWLTDSFIRGRNVLAGLLVFGIILAFSVYSVGLEERDREAHLRIAMFSFISNLGSHVSRELSGVLARAAGLKSYLAVRHDSLRRDEVDAILQELSGSVPTIRNISVAIGYNIQYVHPIKGNEKAIGLDYKTLPAQ